jgi:hypothetical protein
MPIIKPPKVRFVLTFGGFVIFIISNFPLGQASIHKVFAGDRQNKTSRYHPSSFLTGVQ